mmetsp:Transcript_18113/g.27411  ORF Transcript_18113/g.27411 Transcript_18113/m.27411 type:complete len:397 (-) Transcript_18113:177-1367(-)
MGKARVAVRIKDVVSRSKSVNHNINLDALSQRYNDMMKKINRLTTALNKHHSLIKEMSNSRVNVATQISDLAQGSPLESHAGGVENNSESYSAIHQGLSKDVEGYADKYQEFIIGYVVEWNKVISARTKAGLKKTASLRRDLDHYQRKVDELNRKVNATLAKGSPTDAKTKSKMKRNENKLVKAKDAYKLAAEEMCMYLQETVDQGWKDLHPLLVKIAQFDMSLVGEETDYLSGMDTVITALSALALSNNLKVMGRLEELKKHDASSLYAGTKDSPTLAGGDESTYDGSLNSASAGSPQGVDGFPVEVTLELQSLSTPKRRPKFFARSNTPPPLTLEKIDAADDRQISHIPINLFRESESESVSQSGVDSVALSSPGSYLESICPSIADTATLSSP